MKLLGGQLEESNQVIDAGEQNKDSGTHCQGNWCIFEVLYFISEGMDRVSILAWFCEKRYGDQSSMPS